MIFEINFYINTTHVEDGQKYKSVCCYLYQTCECKENYEHPTFNLNLFKNRNYTIRNLAEFSSYYITHVLVYHNPASFICCGYGRICRGIDTSFNSSCIGCNISRARKPADRFYSMPLPHRQWPTS